eukprot:6208506-Pleurochrysis_carterae.AAC.3
MKHRTATAIARARAPKWRWSSLTVHCAGRPVTKSTCPTCATQAEKGGRAAFTQREAKLHWRAHNCGNTMMPSVAYNRE